MTEEYNLYPLHVFRVVARLGSVTRAAQELCISQPAVSSHLKTLQSRYKETLLERTPRGMLLTPAGTICAEQVNRIFALLEDMHAAVRAARGEVRGTIKLAASSTPGAYLVPRLLRLFQDRYSEANATLMVGDSEEVLTWLREYQVPIGVVGEIRMSTGLVREEIARDELRLVSATTDNLSNYEEISDGHLSERTLFLREQGSSTRSGTESILCGRMGWFSRVVELRSTEAIKQSVVAGSAWLCSHPGLPS